MHPTSGGAWFTVEEFDVLVDEWERFLGLPPDLSDFFRRKHGDLFTVRYWEDMQRRVAGGELPHVVPYPPERCPANPPEVREAAGYSAA